MINIISDISSSLANIGYVILALLVFLFMITIHELGHYTAGKILKFKINEFSIGMGPKILSRTKKNGEVFSLRVLPLGGFCQFEGEDEENPHPQAFNKQKPWKRLIVLFSGAFFNIISAVLIGVVAFSCFGDTVAVVNRVYQYSDEHNIELLRPDDIIYKVNGKEVYIAADLSSYMPKSGEKVTLTVIRDGQQVELADLQSSTYTITYIRTILGDYYVDDTQVNSHKLVVGDSIYSINGTYLKSEGQLATILSAVTGDTVNMEILTASGEIVRYENFSKQVLLSNITTRETAYSGLGISIGYDKMIYTFGQSVVRIVPYCFEVAVLVLRTLGGLLTGMVGLEAVGGPITTISLTSQVVASGFGNVLSLIVLISINLAVFNLLPVPALDGCRMIFVLIEWIAGKPINRKVEAWINGIGFIVLIALMVLLEVARLL